LGIFNFELNGEKVLGFDTGLDSRSFARAKMAAFLTQRGSVVYPDGRIEAWKAGGVTEKNTMVIWGPVFDGERMGALIADPERKAEAFEALRRWVKAREAMGKNENIFPGPGGVLINTTADINGGALLFPPERLIKRCLEAEGESAVLAAGSYFHPDLGGGGDIVFSACAMLYRIFCGEPPFKGVCSEELRQNIREGVFIPPRFAAPGLDEDLARLIYRALTPDKTGEKKEALLPELKRILEDSGRPFNAWFSPLPEDEKAKILLEKNRFKKSKAFSVKTRRFAKRNTAVITGCAAALLALLLGIRGFIKHNANLPGTLEMTPSEVAEMYYNAIGTLDHTVMEACVTDGAGKDDINLVTHLFVISKVRQAYEAKTDYIMPASRWLARGSPLEGNMVIGVTDLKLEVIKEDTQEAKLEAGYFFYFPAEMAEAKENPSRAEEAPFLAPKNIYTRDILTLTFRKDRWRISHIERTGR
jgi:hypothetical protein